MSYTLDFILYLLQLKADETIQNVETDPKYIQLRDACMAIVLENKKQNELKNLDPNISKEHYKRYDYEANHISGMPSSYCGPVVPARV